MDYLSISMWISLGLVSILSQCLAAPANNSTTTSNDLSESNSHSNGLDIANIQKVKDDFIQISWTVNDTALSSLSNSRRPSGFVVSYQLAYPTNTSKSSIGKQNNSTTDEGLEFKSAELSSDVRSLSLRLPNSRNITICVYVLYGQSESCVMNSTKKVCSDLSTWEYENKKEDNDNSKKEDEKVSDSKKLIVGVSAGCLFLVPCVFVLVLIMRKDRMMQKSAIYEELGKEHLNTGFQLGEESNDLKKGGGGNGVKKEEGGGGEGIKEGLRRLSVVDLSRAQGPAVYIHTENGDSDNDSYADGARSDVYVERL